MSTDTLEISYGMNGQVNQNTHYRKRENLGHYYMD